MRLRGNGGEPPCTNGAPLETTDSPGRLNSHKGTKTLTGFFATFYARRTFGNSAAPKIGSCLVDEILGLTQPVHPIYSASDDYVPHLMGSNRIAQIQLISGHESKKSLEVYQHLSLESVDKATRMRSRVWGSKKISVGLYVPLLG